MIIDVTYACNMGCSHCMSDCTPDGLHMPIQTFRDSNMEFFRRRNV